jgi:hypothetical protein
MSNSQVESKNEICLKQVCMQVGVWSLLVLGFLIVCVGAPMLALNI